MCKIRGNIYWDLCDTLIRKDISFWAQSFLMNKITLVNYRVYNELCLCQLLCTPDQMKSVRERLLVSQCLWISFCSDGVCLEFTFSTCKRTLAALSAPYDDEDIDVCMCVSVLPKQSVRWLACPVFHKKSSKFWLNIILYAWSLLRCCCRAPVYSFTPSLLLWPPQPALSLLTAKASGMAQL